MNDYETQLESVNEKYQTLEKELNEEVKRKLETIRLLGNDASEIFYVQRDAYEAAINLRKAWSREITDVQKQFKLVTSTDIEVGGGAEIHVEEGWKPLPGETDIEI